MAKDKPSVPATPLTVTIKLDGKERFFIPQLLPTQGSRFKLKMARAILDRIKVDPSEDVEYGIKRTDTGVSWDLQKIMIKKSFKFQDAEIKLIQENIEALDKEERLTSENLDLAERILAIGSKKEE